MCGTCYSRKYRYDNPEKTTYANLRCNARRRVIYFGISYEYFLKFCVDNDYIKLKGIYGDSMTIDRVNHLLGYIEGNLQVLTRIDNGRKGIKEKKARWLVLKSEYDPECGF